MEDLSRTFDGAPGYANATACTHGIGRGRYPARIVWPVRDLSSQEKSHDCKKPPGWYDFRMNALPLQRTIIGLPTRLELRAIHTAQQKAWNMTRIDALSKPPNITARSSAIVISAMRVHDALRTESPAGEDGSGRPACWKAWEQVRRLPAHSWQLLSRSREARNDAPALTAAGALAGCIPYAAIAHEVERALADGWDDSTPLACLLLASIALECFDGGDEAQALAQSALDLAAQLEPSDGNSIRALHAALITARTMGLHQACAVLLGFSKDAALPPAALLYLASTAFAAGMPLAELSHHLDAAQPHEAAQAPLSLRVALIRTLSCPQARQTRAELSLDGPVGPQRALADWLTRLQATWFAGRHEDAIDASRHAAGLIGPLTPLADLLCYHLFSALALGRSKTPDAGAALDMHCLVLHRFACACPSGAAAIAELAGAVRERVAGKSLACLHGLERACDSAARAGQHWVAALASEEAALAAANAGLDSAAAHYRQLALASYRRWGALGRVAMLEREWGELLHAPASEHHAESERLRRAGKAGEIGLSIAHEVNQPLAAIALHSAAARKWLRHPQPNVERALASLALISEAGRHAGEVVRGMQRLASHQENDIDCVAVDPTIREAVRSLQRPLRKHAIKVELALGLGKAVIHANRVQVQQVVTNLLVNAIEALAGTDRSLGPRRIRVASRAAQGEEVEILIEDNGPGIAPSNRERIFGSLFTTKPDNTGLGLSISLAIVRSHHGGIAFEPREPHGARFRVRLPVRGPQSPAPAAMV